MNRLFRSPDDRILAGVAGGIAETWDLDPTLVRVGWAFLILVSGGLFLLLYIVMAVIVPLGPSQATLWNAGMDTQTSAPGPGEPASVTSTGPSPSGSPYAPYEQGPSRYRRHHRRDGTGALIFGLILIAVGAYFLLRQYLPTLNFDLIWPLIVMGGGVLLVVAAFGRPSQRV